MLVIALAALLVLLLVVGLVAVMRAAPRRPRGDFGTTRRERAIEAQIEVEEHDIDEMIEAQNAIRGRLGKPTIGEELGDEALGRDRRGDAG